jgi:ATPase subunit of ABC transporter with duplicated ATPase domains
MNAKQYAESYEKQQQEIKKMEDYINKNKARAATAGMANSRKKMLEKIEVISKPVVIYPSTFNFPYVDIRSKDMLVVKNLIIGYDNPLLPPINFRMDSETKLWIRGTNGIGKSTLLKTLMGKLKSLGGSFAFSINSKKLYLEQDLQFSDSEDSASTYLSSYYPRMNMKEIRTRLGNVGLKNELATKPISNLSGGEQVKAKLCVLMQNESNFLILDEPTNHLDIMAKDSLKNH